MDIFGLGKYLECESHIKDFYIKILNTENIEEKLNYLESLYKYIKMVTPDFYENNQLSNYYKKIKQLIIKCESLLDGYFLISNNPIYKQISTPYLSISNYRTILDYVVYETRQYLLRVCNSQDLSKMHLANYCTISNIKVLNLLDYFGFEDSAYSIILTPGFVKTPQLFDGSGYHCITILNLGERYFLIDCTYSQFFTLRQNSLERIGIMNLMNCKPGKFMTMSDERLNVANELLERGWIELDDKSFKHYLDGFALYYRNGLYYEVTKDYSYTTEYTAKDYRNFLENKDSQLCHENEYTLGYQRVPNMKYL